MITSEVTSLMEDFKAPFRDPYCPNDWKDWYHYILYDPVTRIRLLYNLCFSGKPGTGYVADTFFLTIPKGILLSDSYDNSVTNTYGYARNWSWRINKLKVVPLIYNTKEVEFSIINNQVRLSVENKHSGINFQLKGRPNMEPIYIPELAPYGKGFMGWGIIADYLMKGKVHLGENIISINQNWYGYHDRNFGRFDWGSIGWTWFVANGTDNMKKDWIYVLHRSNNSDYSQSGSPILFVYCEKQLRKIFIGNTINIEVKWSGLSCTPTILPGAMASVFCDRNIRVPVRLTIQAQDETDSVFLKLNVETHTEMIVPDNETKKYTFLKELSGQTEMRQCFGNKKSISTDGFFYAEYVH